MVKSQNNNVIKEQIEQIKAQKYVAQNGFDNTTNPLLINSYIYEIKALDEKLSYLLSQYQR